MFFFGGLKSSYLSCIPCYARRLPLAPLVYTLVRPSVMSGRGFFEKQKLTGPNFIDWYRQLRIILSIEDKLNYIEQPIPPALVVPAEQELLQTTPNFHSCKQKEGKSVSSYVLKMKGFIENIERLGHPVTLGLGVSLILIGLRKEFDGFVQNYNMHSLGKTINELHDTLKLHEQTLPKNNTLALHAIRAGKVQKVNKHKKSQPQMAARGQNHEKGKNKQAYDPKPKIPPPSKREDPAKDSICHECGETGHWKSNCPQYLAELLKKKKNVASGAGGSESKGKTRRAPDSMCLYIDAEEHELGYLGKPANYKVALLDPESKKWLDAMNVEMNTKDMFLVYEGDLKRELRVSCYTDAGYLTDADDHKSQTEYVFVLNGGAVDWKSAKKSIFATSSAEA
nr:hypothetical protein [Tanacetum cinerariifolium]